MKKILLFTITFAFTSVGFGQDAADKKFQAGLSFGAGMNFQKMGTKLLDANGVGSDLTIGGTFVYSFNENIGFNSGIEFDFNTTKYKPGSYNTYYLYNDNTIEAYAAPGNLGIYEGKQLYRLDERKQSATYLTIPTMLVFRTNFIGYFRYFGKFGLRNSFLLSQKINDEGYNFDPDNTSALSQNSAMSNNENMKANNEMFFYKGSVGLAAGAEWNFTGSTCLMFEIGYYYGFSQLYYGRSGKEYLFTAAGQNGTSEDLPFSNKATQSQLQLKVSVLF